MWAEESVVVDTEPDAEYTPDDDKEADTYFDDEF